MLSFVSEKRPKASSVLFIKDLQSLQFPIFELNCWSLI